LSPTPGHGWISIGSLWSFSRAAFPPNYGSWVRLPAAFDELGFPIQHDGSSTVIPGLHFMGVHFQRKRKSATFLGVAEDAAALASNIAASRH
jgi:putative flavoprotein involved in K+ transport